MSNSLREAFEAKRSWQRQRLVEELWNAYLHPCCAGCKTGTADCDVNPLAVIPSEGELALRLMRYGECP